MTTQTEPAAHPDPVPGRALLADTHDPAKSYLVLATGTKYGLGSLHRASFDEAAHEFDRFALLSAPDYLRCAEETEWRRIGLPSRSQSTSA